MTLGVLLLALVIDGGASGAASPGPGSGGSADDAPQTPSTAAKVREASTSDATFAADVSIDFTRVGKAAWWELTPSATFNIGSHWSIEAGLPCYVVNGAFSADHASHAGLGDVYGSLSLDLSGDETTFYTTLSVSAPTGNVSQGLGYGQVTWDWTNHVDRSFGRFAPYADVGFANAIDLTSRVNRSRAAGRVGPPQAQVGNVFNGEGGVEYSFSYYVSLSVSGYVIAPFGQQTAVTGAESQRVRTVLHTSATSQHDRGISSTLTAGLSRGLDVSVWFWHSSTFHDDTLSVDATVHVSELFKR
jgi:hypothetical protein